MTSTQASAHGAGGRCTWTFIEACSIRARALTGDLETLFDVPRVDLVVLGEASPLLAVEVIRGELLYTDDPLGQAEHELYILRRAADLAPFQRERVQQIFTARAVTPEK